MLTLILFLFLLIERLSLVAHAEVVVSTLFIKNGKGRNTGISGSFRLPFPPNSLAIGRYGSIYISDGLNHRIQRLLPSGILSRFAGNGTQNFHDGPSTQAMFSYPSGMLKDRHGYLYVSDIMNNAVRRIAPNGFVTTVAGNGTAGNADGVGSSAMFNAPYSMTMDSRGNLFVADSVNHMIRRIKPDGFVTTYAGSGEEGHENGPRLQATFSWPTSVVFDSRGNLYVIDNGNAVIRRISPTGIVSTFAGAIGESGFIDGPPDQARFKGVSSITIDPQDNLYVSDTSNHAIRRITPDGFVTTIAGTSKPGHENGYGCQATFNGPEGILYHKGSIYVADYSNWMLRKIDLNPKPMPKRHVSPRPIQYDQEECAICCEAKQVDQEYYYCSEECGQSFHAKCIRDCLSPDATKKCPMCRASWVRERKLTRIPSDKSISKN